MNLYEMNDNIELLLEKLVETADPETGEINADIKEALDNLKEERDEKLENIGIYMKKLRAEALAIKQEEATLASRRQTKEKAYERLKAYVSGVLLADGQRTFETPRIVYTFRRSKSVNITGQVPNKFIIKQVTEKPDKKALLEALKQGWEIEGAELIENDNLQIK